MRTNLLVTALSMAACLAMACGPSSSIIPIVDSNNNVVDAAPTPPSDDASDANTNSDDASDANSNPDCDTNDTGTPDSGTVPDSGHTTPDSGTEPDSGVPGRDGGFPRTLPDAGPDSGSEPDSGTVVDSGTKPDSGTPVVDSGTPGHDAGTCTETCVDAYNCCVTACKGRNFCTSDESACVAACQCTETTCQDNCSCDGVPPPSNTCGEVKLSFAIMVSVASTTSA
jgi:hypothetical protein